MLKLNNVYDSYSDEELDTYIDTNWIIHPNSYFKYYWDFFLFVFTLISLIEVPIVLAFLDFCNIDRTTVLLIDIIIDLYFILDLIINFFVGYYDFEENEILNRNKIAMNYLDNYFIYDFISGIPANSLSSSRILLSFFQNSAWNLLRLLRLAKFLKFIIKNKTMKQDKIIKKIFFPVFVKNFYNFRINFSPRIKQLLRYSFFFFVISHILTCTFIYVSQLSIGSNWTKLLIDQPEKCNNTRYYLASYYFTWATLFTIGYGDIFPVSIPEKLFSLVLLICGMIIYSFSVSYLSGFTSNSNKREIELEKNIEYLHDLSILNNVPWNLYKKVRNFLKYSHKSHKDDRNIFIFDLPKNLRNEIICFMYKDIIFHFTFFKRTSNQDFNAKVILALRPVSAFKHEELIKKGDFVEEIIFVRRGGLSLQTEYRDIIIKLINIGRFEHFGEVFLFKNQRSPLTVVVKSNNCELYLLRKIDLIKIAADFQEIFEEIFKNSDYNMRKIKKIIKMKKIIIDNIGMKLGE